MDAFSLLGLQQDGQGSFGSNAAAGFAEGDVRRKAALDQQKTLQDMFIQRQADARLQELQPGAVQAQGLTNAGLGISNQKGLLANQETEALQPLKIDAAKSDAAIANMAKMGQMALQIAPAFEKMPPEQRQQALAAIGQKVPGLADSPVFQGLASADPRMLPAMMKEYGTKLLLETQDHMQKMGLGKQREDAAMARQQAQNATQLQVEGMQQGGANARNAATMSNQMDLERMRIDAGKYQRKQQGVSTLMDIAGKAGYEKAAVAATMMAKDRDASQEDRDYYNQLAQEFNQRHVESRSAGAYAKPMIDPATGDLTLQAPYGRQGSAPAGASAAPVPPSLPQGTKPNGDGTFTLPDGRRVKPKQ